MSETVQHYLQFRHATVADAPVMAEIWMRSCEEKSEEGPQAEPERSQLIANESVNLAYMLSESDQDDYDGYKSTIIASAGGKALGYITYEFMFNQIEVESLYVVDHGLMTKDGPLRVGQALHRKAIGLKQGLTSVFAGVLNEASPFYKKMGYQADIDQIVHAPEMTDMIMPKDNIDAWHLTALSGWKRPSFEF